MKIPTALKENEVFIKMEAAPINPADLNIVEGTYPNIIFIHLLYC